MVHRRPWTVVSGDLKAARGEDEWISGEPRRGRQRGDLTGLGRTVTPQTILTMRESAVTPARAEFVTARPEKSDRNKGIP